MRRGRLSLCFPNDAELLRIAGGEPEFGLGRVGIYSPLPSLPASLPRRSFLPSRRVRVVFGQFGSALAQGSSMASAAVAGVSGAARPLMRLITMSGVPILKQLHLEEQLLRCTVDNWCVINDGTAPPTIVMGVSGRVSELVKIQAALRDQVPVVRRFSGGVTVIVDQGTIFVTFICNKSDIAELQPFPRDIMSWSGQLYGKVFDRFGEFHLRENDYAFSHRKFGGNAQSITKNRWVHHTSFLWDYDVKNMDYLKIPKRVPEYRLERDHTDFLCRMIEYMPSRSVFTDGVIVALGEHFTVEPTDLQTVLSDEEEFVPSTKMLSQHDLEEIVSSKESLSRV